MGIRKCGVKYPTVEVCKNKRGCSYWVDEIGCRLISPILARPHPKKPSLKAKRAKTSRKR